MCVWVWADGLGESISCHSKRSPPAKLVRVVHSERYTKLSPRKNCPLAHFELYCPMTLDTVPSSACERVSKRIFSLQAIYPVSNGNNWYAPDLKREGKVRFVRCGPRYPTVIF